MPKLVVAATNLGTILVDEITKAVKQKIEQVYPIDMQIDVNSINAQNVQEGNGIPHGSDVVHVQGGNDSQSSRETDPLLTQSE